MSIIQSNKKKNESFIKIKIKIRFNKTIMILQIDVVICGWHIWLQMKLN